MYNKMRYLTNKKNNIQVPENACTYNEKTVTNQPGTFRRCLYRTALRMADWSEVKRVPQAKGLEPSLLFISLTISTSHFPNIHFIGKFSLL